MRMNGQCGNLLLFFAGLGGVLHKARPENRRPKEAKV
jgi:hypothetical protein